MPQQGGNLCVGNATAEPMTGIVDEAGSYEAGSYAGRFQSDPEPHPLHPFAIGCVLRLIL